jgi:hypothetical protein
MAPKAEPTPSPITLPELEGIIGKSGGQCYAVEFAASLLTKIQRGVVHPGGSNEDAPRALCSAVEASRRYFARGPRDFRPQRRLCLHRLP